MKQNEMQQEPCIIIQVQWSKTLKCDNYQDLTVHHDHYWSSSWCTKIPFVDKLGYLIIIRKGLGLGFSQSSMSHVHQQVETPTLHMHPGAWSQEQQAEFVLVHLQIISSCSSSALLSSSTCSTAGSSWQRCVGDISPPQLGQGSALLSFLDGDTESKTSEEVSRNFSGELGALCDFPMWIFKPLLVLNNVSHWSHLNARFSTKACWLASRSAWFSSEADVVFLARNCFLRLAFLSMVEGLALFFSRLGIVLPPESREKEKVLPMVRENLKALPWLFSAWQRARHLLAREESFSLTAAIFAYFWSSKGSAGARRLDMLSLSLLFPFV